MIALPALRHWLADWAAFVRPGDVLVLAGGLVVAVVSAQQLWQGGAPDKAVIKSGGKVFAEVALNVPLGTTRVEIQPGRARVASDPGPRQYCVRQGWLSTAGSVAICAPNQVSLSLSGRSAAYDSLNY
jgi:hypothetical protein